MQWTFVAKAIYLDLLCVWVWDSWGFFEHSSDILCAQSLHFFQVNEVKQLFFKENCDVSFKITSFIKCVPQSLIYFLDNRNTYFLKKLATICLLFFQVASTFAHLATYFIIITRLYWYPPWCLGGLTCPTKPISHFSNGAKTKIYVTKHSYKKW